MKVDTISFEVEETLNPNYEQDLKEYQQYVKEREADGDVVDWECQSSRVFITPYLLLNGEYIGATISPSAFIRTKTTKDCYTYWDGSEVEGRKYSLFEPLTCSCGVSGCAGIWDGIHMKVRKHTVEWRVPKKGGYEGRLDKSFYSFDKEQYFGSIRELQNKVKYYAELYPEGDQLIFL